MEICLTKLLDIRLGSLTWPSSTVFLSPVRQQINAERIRHHFLSRQQARADAVGDQLVAHLLDHLDLKTAMATLDISEIIAIILQHFDY